MNIVVFSPSWPQKSDANGIVTYCSNMVSALREQGHKVYVLTGNLVGEQDGYVYELNYNLPLLERLHGLIGEFFSPGYRQYYFGAQAILRAIREIENECIIDILEIEESFGWHYYLQKRVQFPTVMRLHGPYYMSRIMDKALQAADENRLKRERRAFEAAKYVSAPSQWVLNKTQQKYGLHWPLSQVFFNPIKLMEPKECWNPTSYIQNQILFVGRFDTLKGGDLVIEAFANVLRLIPNATLVFAGPDLGLNLPNNKKMFIQDAIDQYIPKEQHKNVYFLGLVDQDKIKALRATSHITIMTSRKEVFGYTVLEALAAASPVIAANTCGISEVFIDHESGVYFNSADADDLSEKMLMLLKDTKLLEHLSVGAQKRCEDVFSAPLVAREAVNFFNQVIEHHVK